MEDIVRINIRIRSDEPKKKSSSETVVYKDHIVCPMSSHSKETWNYIKRLITMLEEARGEYTADEGEVMESEG